MQYVATHDIQFHSNTCLIIPVQGKKLLTQFFLPSNVRERIVEVLATYEATGGDETLIIRGSTDSLIPTILLVFLNPNSALSDERFSKLLHQLSKTLQTNQISTVYFDLFTLQVGKRTLNQKVKITIQTLEAAFYQFQLFKTAPAPKIFLKTVSFYTKELNDTALTDAIREGLAIVKGVNLAKDLSNTPANHATPKMIATAVKKMSELATHVTYECFDTTDVTVQKMGAFLSVAKGSVEPPQFVVIHYTPPQMAHIPPIVLVGKGVTFDAGGISIKPASQMDEMKFDMAGAASVIGAIASIAELKPSVPVVGILPLAENLPSGSALKPGDVIQTLSGQTVEVLNTDAEGRLILADALTYSRRLNPAIVLDIATLTGAVEVALGNALTGLMTNDKELQNLLEKAGIIGNDPAWPLPLSEPYQRLIDSNIADMANLGPRGAGAITAGCFLARFTKGLRWAHLDIAGTAYISGKHKAATGRPVPLLVEFILAYAKTVT